MSLDKIKEILAEKDGGENLIAELDELETNLETIKESSEYWQAQKEKIEQEKSDAIKEAEIFKAKNSELRLANSKLINKTNFGDVSISKEKEERNFMEDYINPKNWKY